MSGGAATSRPLATVLRNAIAQLTAAGVESPDSDARLLAAAALGLDRTALLLQRDRILDAAEAAVLQGLIDRRAAREPVSRILGRRGFWTLNLALSPATLDPRPDSETVVEAALDAAGDKARPLRLLDLGTGSGCLLLALLAELPQAVGLGLDRSEAACRTAAANAAAHGLGHRALFCVGDWAAPLGARFELIVSNPPYVRRGEIAGLEPEVARFDPPAALDGGSDGLAAYRDLAAALPRLLADGGTAVLEIGAGQGPDVTAILAGEGLAVAAIRSDLSGTPRAVVCRPAEKTVGMRPLSG